MSGKTIQNRRSSCSSIEWPEMIDRSTRHDRSMVKHLLAKKNVFNFSPLSRIFRKWFIENWFVNVELEQDRRREHFWWWNVWGQCCVKFCITWWNWMRFDFWLFHSVNIFSSIPISIARSSCGLRISNSIKLISNVSSSPVFRLFSSSQIFNQFPSVFSFKANGS